MSFGCERNLQPARHRDEGKVRELFWKHFDDRLNFFLYKNRHLGELPTSILKCSFPDVHLSSEKHRKVKRNEKEICSNQWWHLTCVLLCKVIALSLGNISGKKGAQSKKAEMKLISYKCSGKIPWNAIRVKLCFRHIAWLMKTTYFVCWIV